MAGGPDIYRGPDYNEKTQPPRSTVAVGPEYNALVQAVELGWITEEDAQQAVEG